VIAIFYGIFYQNLNATSIAVFLTSVNIWFYGTIAAIVSTIAFLAVILWDYFKDFRAISRMIEDIKDGKRLKPLEKLNSKGMSQTKKEEPLPK
jgi:hypothetical protein